MGKGDELEIEKPKESLETGTAAAININSKLSPHCIQVILDKFPTPYLPYYRLVCKTWNDVILDYKSLQNPFFIALVCGDNLPSLLSQWRFKRVVYCIDFDAKRHDEGMEFVASFQLRPFHFSWYKFVTSCNGLVCIKRKTSDNSFCYVFNPMRNEYIEVPKSKQMDSGSYFYRLGFGLKTKRYKMIRVTISSNNHTVSAIDIFTLGCNNEWRSVKFTPFDIYCRGRELYSAYLNGAIYWVGKDNEKRNFLCRFDVEDEKFEMISFPMIDLSDVYIQVFNGSLYVTLCNKQKQPYEIEVWTMRSHEAEALWMREFVVKNIPKKWRLLHLIKIYEDGDILFLVQLQHLFLYDRNNETIKKVIRKDGMKFFSVHQIQSPNFDSLNKMMDGDRSFREEEDEIS